MLRKDVRQVCVGMVQLPDNLPCLALVVHQVEPGLHFIAFLLHLEMVPDKDFPPGGNIAESIVVHIRSAGLR